MTQNKKDEQTPEETKVDEIADTVIIGPYAWDSTSVQEIQTIMGEDDGDHLGDSELYLEVRYFVEEGFEDTSKDALTRLEEGLDYLRGNGGFGRHFLCANVCQLS